MRSRFVRSATRSGWRGVALLGLIPVLVGLFSVAVLTHGVAHTAAYCVHVAATAVFLVIAWRLCFGDRDA